MAKKVVLTKRQVDGFEAPRNSLERPLETFNGLRALRDDLQYSYHMTKESSSKNCFPVKTLMSKEISTRPKNTNQNLPSVVARLMGVEILPLYTKSVAQLGEIKDKPPAGQLLDKTRPEKGSNISQQLLFGSCGHFRDSYSDMCSSRTQVNKYKTREHPQEEELQKFKKKFEAWQAARFKECSKVVEFSSNPTQLIAQADLNREKIFFYANSERTSTCEMMDEPKDFAVLAGPHETLTLQSCKRKNNYDSSDEKNSLCSNAMTRTCFSDSQPMNSDRLLDMASASANIVVLRPGFTPTGLDEGSWNSTPCASQYRGSVEDFLEEVKERLKIELQGKSSKRSITARGGGIETPYWEKPSESREIALNLAQEVREIVTKDLGMDLIRSGSTKSYGKEIWFNGSGSPEFINRDTRRLRNGLKGEANQEIPMADCFRSRLLISNNNTGISGRSRYLNKFTNELEKPNRSFRRELDGSKMYQKEPSPQSLARSLSAPVSGTPFGKLLLEDRRVSIGVQIRRKHEIIDKVSMKTKKQKKETFNIKEKVSTLTGKLFLHRRVKSTEEPHQNKNHLLRDITSGPTVLMSSFETNENSTEVPPSPASVCSSSHDEFWRPMDNSSPSSFSGVHQLEDGDMSCVFRELNSNLNELRKKLNLLEFADPEEDVNEQQPSEVEVDIENQDEAYIKELLVAAGLYDGSYNRSLSKWDPLGKPISNHVFEEVEDSYRTTTEVDDLCSKYHRGKLNHKMVFDLLNEVLPNILRPPINQSKYMEKAFGYVHKPPLGKKLLFHIWEFIRLYVNPPSDKSYYALDSLLTRDWKMSTWSHLIDDDMNSIGREIESQIMEEMIEEMVEDIEQ
ncbi:uncharacterized protein [Henckelia pumila]|uniref:uncharacterized protein n=1 Tax=Henckelia pumila TaxID=405737 RepID=UPI003C6DF8DA